MLLFINLLKLYIFTNQATNSQWGNERSENFLHPNLPYSFFLLLYSKRCNHLLLLRSILKDNTIIIVPINHENINLCGRGKRITINNQ